MKPENINSTTLRPFVHNPDLDCIPQLSDVNVTTQSSRIVGHFPSGQSMIDNDLLSERNIYSRFTDKGIAKTKIPRQILVDFLLNPAYELVYT